MAGGVMRQPRIQLFSAAHLDLQYVLLLVRCQLLRCALFPIPARQGSVRAPLKLGLRASEATNWLATAQHAAQMTHSAVLHIVLERAVIDIAAPRTAGANVLPLTPTVRSRINQTPTTFLRPPAQEHRTYWSKCSLSYTHAVFYRVLICQGVIHNCVFRSSFRQHHLMNS